MNYVRQWTAAPAAARETITADRTYYIRTDGSDSNTGLVDSAGGAFLTTAKGVAAAKSLNTAGFDVILKHGSGTRTVQIVLCRLDGGGRGILRGDTTTPANCIQSVTSNHAITADNTTKWLIEGFDIRTITSGSGLRITNGSVVEISGKTTFGVSAGDAQIFVGSGAGLYVYASEIIVNGNAAKHIYALSGFISYYPSGVTVSGTPAFSAQFALADTVGEIDIYTTFTGSATGQRYKVIGNAAIQTYGLGVTLFPGDVAGTTDTGGQYGA